MHRAISDIGRVAVDNAYRQTVTISFWLVHSEGMVIKTEIYFLTISFLSTNIQCGNVQIVITYYVRLIIQLILL